MTRKEFSDQIVERRIELIKKSLQSKAEEYALDESAFYNFEESARIDNETTEEALWGMFKKHFISVKDMKDGKIELTKQLIDEKIGDSINYLILLEGILNNKLKTGD